MKNIISSIGLFALLVQFGYAQNVGIGTLTPNYKLDVLGSIRASATIYANTNLEVTNNVFINGGLGIGGTSVIEKLNILGNIRLTNSDPIIQLQQSGVNTGFLQLSGNDVRIGTYSGNTTGNFIIRTNGGSRVTVTPSGDMAVSGDISTAGDMAVSNNLLVNNNVYVGGTITVGGKGIAYNGGAATSLRIAPFTTANFHAILGPHSSGETSIVVPSGFTNAPRVFVGNINSTGGSGGELNRVILVLSGCTTTSCVAKIINTDDAAIDYNITWDCMAIGN